MRILVVVLILVTSACTPVYIPNSRSIPLFEEAGEVSLDGYLGSAGIDLNAGVAVSKHVAIIGNFSFDNSSGENLEEFHRHKFGELGLGYFNTPENKLRTEFFGGFGLGEATSFDSYFFISPTEELTTGTYNRAFIQGNLGYKPGEVFQFGAAVRLSYTTFTNFESTASGAFSKSQSAGFAEPTFFLKVGDPVHFTFQVGFNVPLDETPVFDYRPFHLSLGVGVNIKGKRKSSTEGL